MKPEKHITLLAAGMLVLAVFFMLPRSQTWMAQDTIRYWKDFKVQRSMMDPEIRKIKRYGASYILSKQIADFFRSKHLDKSVLVMVPSTAYFKNNGMNYPVPEPAVFYYFTGLKTVSPGSPEAVKSNWFIRAEKGKIIFDSVTSISILADSIRAFNQFPVSP